MRRHLAAASVALLALLGTAAPAVAAPQVTAISGRVLDETGRPVAGATVQVSGKVPGGVADAIFGSLACLFSFFSVCDLDLDVGAKARTDAHGRYVLRFASYPKVKAPIDLDVSVTAPTLVRNTLPAETKTSLLYRGGALPTYRLWLRGASADPVNATYRRLRAGVPASLGRPVRPAKVNLVYGAVPVWSYGEIGGDHIVDSRVFETGTTGTQSTVTTRVGSRSVTYRSGVRSVSTLVTPFSRGKACYGYHDPATLQPWTEYPGCPVTNGALSGPPIGQRKTVDIVIDFGELVTPEAYVVRGCDLDAVSVSVEGVVFHDVSLQEKERGVYTGTPLLPARYVRIDKGVCAAHQISVFGSPFSIPPPTVATLR